MTDNEIIKANDILDKFDFFNQKAGYEHWIGMPKDVQDKDIKDKENDIKFLKDLINRQQAEIERLKASRDKWKEIAIIFDQAIRDKDATIEMLEEMVGDTE